MTTRQEYAAPIQENRLPHCPAFQLLTDYRAALHRSVMPKEEQSAHLWQVERLIDRVGENAVPGLSKTDIIGIVRSFPLDYRSCALLIYSDFFDFLVSSGICKKNPLRYGLRRFLPHRYTR